MRRPLYDSLLLAAPFAVAARRFRSDPALWLPPPALAEDDGVVVTMRAAGLLAAAGVDAVVHVDSTSLDQERLIVRPIAWRAAAADRVFPRLAADLELEAVSETACRLTLVGGYQPPVSVVGDAADRLVGRHIAESVVRTFLESVAGVLAPSPSPPTLRV